MLGLDILIPSKGGNIHLDFRNSLLKYARNKRTLDYPVKEKIKAMSYSLLQII